MRQLHQPQSPYLLAHLQQVTNRGKLSHEVFDVTRTRTQQRLRMPWPSCPCMAAAQRRWARSEEERKNMTHVTLGLWLRETAACRILVIMQEIWSC